MTLLDSILVVSLIQISICFVSLEKAKDLSPFSINVKSEMKNRVNSNETNGQELESFLNEFKEVRNRNVTHSNDHSIVIFKFLYLIR